MKKEIETRVLNIADNLLATKKTIRELATDFHISKSTVHKDLHERLKELDQIKYKDVEAIMQHHIDIRHLRGGESTRQKYKTKR